MADTEADIKESIRVLTENLDGLRTDWETASMMKLSEQSLSAFLDEEPDLYTLGDIRIIHSP